MKLCTDCEHFRGKAHSYKPDRFDLSSSTCAWRGVHTVCGVTGKVWENRTTAWIERRFSFLAWLGLVNKCGPDGRHFKISRAAEIERQVKEAPERAHRERRGDTLT